MPDTSNFCKVCIGTLIIPPHILILLDVSYFLGYYLCMGLSVILYVFCPNFCCSAKKEKEISTMNLSDLILRCPGKNKVILRYGKCHRRHQIFLLFKIFQCEFSVSSSLTTKKVRNHYLKT